MAQDATGTPTSPDNIPTFNTSVDAPSGNGSNAQMAAIQAALNTRLNTPAGIATGEVPVWNGSTWVRSSTLGFSPSGISGYPNDITKELRGDGSWGKMGLKLLYDTADAGVSFPTATITTPTLDSTFGSLLVVWRARSSAAALSANLYVRPNSDAVAGDYNSQFIRCAGTTMNNNEQLGTIAGIYMGDIPAATAEASSVGSGDMIVQGYNDASGNYRKSFVGKFINVSQAASGTSGFLQIGIAGGRWSTAQLITTLTFFLSVGSFNSANDTRFSVYGIAG